MVTYREHWLIFQLVRYGIWGQREHMRTVEVYPKWGTRWLFNWIKKRQVVDDWHHAPCCPANHYCRAKLVFSRCNCGAEVHEIT